MRKIFLGLALSTLLVGCSEDVPTQIYKDVKVKKVEYNWSKMDADYKVTVEHEGNTYLFEAEREMI